MKIMKIEQAYTVQVSFIKSGNVPFYADFIFFGFFGFTGPP